jgi:hypothetical protein
MIKWRYFMMIVRTRSAVGSTINDESFSWANSMPDDVDIVANHLRSRSDQNHGLDSLGRDDGRESH